MLFRDLKLVERKIFPLSPREFLLSKFSESKKAVAPGKRGRRPAKTGRKAKAPAPVASDDDSIECDDDSINAGTAGEAALAACLDLLQVCVLPWLGHACC